MTNSQSTKRALLASVLSVVLCFAMLIGSTFAWFTDSVTSGKNKIVAGNLDVELYTKDVNGEYTTVVGEDTNLLMDGALWEPGHVEVINLKVANLGTLALKYKFGVNIASEKGSTNVFGEEFNLSDFIKFAMINEEKTYANTAAGREQAIKDAETAGSALISAMNIEQDGVLYPTTKVDKDHPAEQFVTLVVYMPTTVDNHANYKTAEGVEAPEIELGIDLVATQVPYESDSFGTDYDKDAAYPPVEVATAEELNGALADATDGAVILLNCDIDLTDDLIISGKNVTLDLNQKTITGSVFSAGDKTLTLKNGKIYRDKTNIDNSQHPALFVYNGSHTVVKNVEITSDNQYAISVYGELTVEKATVKAEAYAFACFDSAVLTVNDAQVTANGHCISTAAAYSEPDMVVTVKGGSFTSSGAEWSDCPIYWAGHGILNVYGGTFKGGAKAAGIYQKNGTVNISDGLFSAKDGAKLAAEAADSTEISFNACGGSFQGTRSGLYYKTTSNAVNCVSFAINITGGEFIGTGEYSSAPYVSLAGTIQPMVSITGSNLANS